MFGFNLKTELLFISNKRCMGDYIYEGWAYELIHCLKCFIASFFCWIVDCFFLIDCGLAIINQLGDGFKHCCWIYKAALRDILIALVIIIYMLCKLFHQIHVIENRSCHISFRSEATSEKYFAQWNHKK
mgnify:CR=1 FL=1